MSNTHQRRPRPDQRLALAAALALLALGLAGAALAAPSAGSLDPQVFPLPDVLRPSVELWTRVYAHHDSDQALLHDERYLAVVYELLDFSDLEALSETRRRLLRRQRIRDAEARYRGLLAHLAAGRKPEALGPELARIEAMFADVPGGRGKYTAAMDRMRTQTCLRDRFAKGIERSGLFLPDIERIFAQRGLPAPLAHLPFVESLFHPGARSRAAAGGIWQFVPGTARAYLRMELEFDQRFDPLRASEAAASHLLGNYRALGTWPLALTAYNHGRYGMMRAVRQLGTRDIGTIVERYRSRSFGFASRNFYAEFLAANAVYEARDRLFPGVAPLPPARFETLVPDRFVSAPALAAAAGEDLDRVRALNPALSPGIWRDELWVPKGYELRVPDGQGDTFARALAGLGDSHTGPRQKGIHYRVRSGDTLAAIAARHGSSVRAIQSANKLRDPHRIRVGQRLYIPARGSGGSKQSASRSSSVRGPRTHVVRRGDTLFAIARRYGTSVRALRSTNGLRSSVIRPSQVLKIP